MKSKNNPEGILFNFHDIVGVRIQTDCMDACRFFTFQYKHHQTKSIPNFLPCVFLSFKNSKMLSGRLKGYTRHAHKLFAVFDYKIRFTGQNIHIQVIGNKLSIPIIHHFLLHSCIRYLVSTCQGIMLHASAVLNKNRSILFAGPSGCGKTTIAALSVSGAKNSWQFHSDDYVFCVSGSRSLSYNTPLHIYQNLLRCMPDMIHCLTLRESFKIKVFGVIRQISAEKVKCPVRIDPDRFWRGNTRNRESKTAALMLISPSGNGQFKAVPVKLNARLIEQISHINFNEVKNFLNLVQKSECIADFTTWKNEWRKRETDNLAHLLDTIETYRLECPRINHRLDPNMLDRFLKFLEDRFLLKDP